MMTDRPCHLDRPGAAGRRSACSVFSDFRCQMPPEGKTNRIGSCAQYGHILFSMLQVRRQRAGAAT